MAIPRWKRRRFIWVPWGTNSDAFGSAPTWSINPTFGVCFWKEKTQKQDSWCVPECLDTQIPYRIWDPGSSPRSPAFSPEPSPPQKVKPLELTWWQRLPKWKFQAPSQGEGKFANHGATMTAMKQRVPEPKRTRMGLACKHLTTPALLAQTRFSTQEYSKDWTSK